MHPELPDFSIVRAKGDPGETVVAVGDIHGRLDLLDPLVENIAASLAESENQSTVVFLGDYIDRGDDSFGVLKYLASVKNAIGDRAIFLLGNHEVMMLSFLNGETDGKLWMANGGQQCLYSLGLPPIPRRATEDERQQSRAALKKRLEPVQDFLDSLSLYWRWGDFFFCHAGLDPSVDLENQQPETLVWGHPRFRDDVRGDDLCVVHGHYVSSEVHVSRSRIGLDTGAYFSGVLSAVRINSGELKLIKSTRQTNNP